MNKLIAKGLILETMRADRLRIAVVGPDTRRALDQFVRVAHDVGLKFEARRAHGDARVHVRDTIIYFCDTQYTSSHFRGALFDLVYLYATDIAPDLLQGIMARTKELVRA